MDPATDCTVDKTAQTASKVNVMHKPAESLPELFTVGDLVKALNHRGYECNRDTVSNFVNKRKIQPAGYASQYRLFNRVVLDLLRVWLKKRGKLKRA